MAGWERRETNRARGANPVEERPPNVQPPADSIRPQDVWKSPALELRDINQQWGKVKVQLPCGSEQWSYWKKDTRTRDGVQPPTGEERRKARFGQRRKSRYADRVSPSEDRYVVSPISKGTAPPGHHNTRPLHQWDPSSRSLNPHHLPGVEADSNFVSRSAPPEPHSVDVDTASEQWWSLLGTQSWEAVESGRDLR